MRLISIEEGTGRNALSICLVVSSAFLFNRKSCCLVKTIHTSYTILLHTHLEVRYDFLNPRQSLSFFPRKLAHREHTSHRHHLYQLSRNHIPDLPISLISPVMPVCNQQRYLQMQEQLNWIHIDDFCRLIQHLDIM